jgi:flagellar capping protein FliD
MPTISFGGLASGLDTSAIISALMKIEQQPIQKLEAEKKNTSFKIDLIGSFEKYVDKLHDAAKDLSTNEDVKEFYLGLSTAGRKSFRDVKHYRRRKRWLA